MALQKMIKNTSDTCFSKTYAEDDNSASSSSDEDDDDIGIISSGSSHSGLSEATTVDNMSIASATA